MESDKNAGGFPPSGTSKPSPSSSSGHAGAVLASNSPQPLSCEERGQNPCSPSLPKRRYASFCRGLARHPTMPPREVEDRGMSWFSCNNQRKHQGSHPKGEMPAGAEPINIEFTLLCFFHHTPYTKGGSRVSPPGGTAPTLCPPAPVSTLSTARSNSKQDGLRGSSTGSN